MDTSSIALYACPYYDVLFSVFLSFSHIIVFLFFFF